MGTAADFAVAINKIGAIAPRTIFAELGADIPVAVLESPWGQQPLDGLRAEIRQAVVVSLDFLHHRLTTEHWRKVISRLEELDALLNVPESTDERIRESAARVVRDALSAFRHHSE